jgi:hypothetical protein
MTSAREKTLFFELSSRGARFASGNFLSFGGYDLV